MLIKPSTINDLYHLSKVLEPNDFVSAQTTRKVKVGGEDTRARTARTTAYVQVEATKITLDYSSESLRVAGKVKQGPESIPLDSAHTLSVELGAEVRIQKNWKQHQVDRLKQAEKQASEAKVLVCCLDDEEASFASLTDSGINMLATFELSLARKAEGAEKEKDQLAKVAEHLNSLDNSMKPHSVVLASPSFWKDELFKVVKVRFPKLVSKIRTASVNSAGGSGINELLNKGILDQAEQESRLQQEFSLVENMRLRIAKKGLADYGFSAVKKAAEKSAVEKLLLSEKVIQDFRDKKSKELDYVIDLVEKNKGTVFVISSDHEAGRILDGLGGIAALLRFKVQ